MYNEWHRLFHSTNMAIILFTTQHQLQSLLVLGLLRWEIEAVSTQTSDEFWLKILHEYTVIFLLFRR